MSDPIFTSSPEVAPLISVIIPNYNHAQYLPKALNSLLAQNFVNMEILIVDDGSTDHSCDIIAEYSNKDPRIRAIMEQVNQGVCAAANKGLREARGPYVHIMGADDFRLPGFLQKTMDVLLAHPSIGIACSDFAYVRGATNDGNVCANKLLQGVHTPRIFLPQETVSLFQTTHFWIPGHTAVFRKDIAILCGSHAPELEHHCDWMLMHTIALRAGVAYVPGTLSVWWLRNHSYATTGMQDRHNKREIYRRVLTTTRAQEPAIRSAFRRSTLLYPMLKEMLHYTWYRPAYWPYYLYLIRKSLYLRIGQGRFNWKRLNLEG